MNEPIIHTLTTEQYGTYWAEFVGVLDYALLLRELGVKEFDKWTSVYQPFRYFGILNQIQLHDHIDENGRTMYLDRQAVFVPTEQVCKQWDHCGTDYGIALEKLGRKKIKFPFISSRAKIQKWQNSLPDNLLTPAWTEGCRTVDDLIREHEKAYPSVCNHCYHGRI